MCRLLRSGVDEGTEREREGRGRARARRRKRVLSIWIVMTMFGCVFFSLRACLNIPNRKPILQCITRYFDDPRDPNAATQSRRTVCENCGAEGKQKTAVCPVRICLTCGACDEHSTWSCSITKVHFTCGMKGHINAVCVSCHLSRCDFVDSLFLLVYFIYRLEKICSLQNCPNGRSGCAVMSSRNQECFSSYDKTNISSTKPLLARQRKSRFFTQECSTLWRIYEYFSEAQQHATLEPRLEKKGLLLVKGGEAYFAEHEW
ncbi:hypothetical protein BJ165DRAFT_236936 [Panaeolus papilionaceus]|nr:hypothetical protein BJ165DRAFT_236936 [Panaeolus papilionaceus]